MYWVTAGDYYEHPTSGYEKACMFNEKSEGFEEAVEQLLLVNDSHWAEIYIPTDNGYWTVSTLIWMPNERLASPEKPDFKTDGTGRVHVFNHCGQKLVAEWYSNNDLSNCF